MMLLLSSPPSPVTGLPNTSEPIIAKPSVYKCPKRDLKLSQANKKRRFVEEQVEALKPEFHLESSGAKTKSGSIAEFFIEKLVK